MSNATLQLGGGNFAVKDGKLLGYATDPKTSAFVSREFDFSRGSNLAATRVDANGLIEKGRENLLLQSNQFDTTWTLTSSITLTSGQSGYDGTSDAWLLERTSTGGQRVAQAISQSGVQTFSVYAKANVGDWLYMRCNTSGSPVEGYFDLSNGVLGSSGLGTRINAQIENVGNGWYRCSMTFRETITEARLYPVDENGSVFGTNESIYIQDAQLEAGLVATDYIETGATTAQAGILEDMPRIDYTNSSSPALLLEPQRTNNINKSEYFGSHGQGGGAGFVITDNYTESPEGYNNAARIQYTSGNTYMVANSINMSIGEVVTMSIYAKGTAGAQFRLYCDGSSGAAINTEFILTADWKRYETTSSAATASGILNPHILVGYGSSNPADDFQVYGWQGEKGSYATSYIPTYGTAVTRSADGSPSVTSLQSKGIFGSTTGTALVEYNPELPNYVFDWHITATKYIRLFYSLPSETLQVRDTIASQWYFTGLSLPKNQNTKVLLRWNGTTLTAFVNGVKAASDYTLTETIAVDYITFFKTDKTKSVLFFPTALSDAECIALTTL